MSEKRKKTKLKEGGPRRSSGPPESLIGKFSLFSKVETGALFLKQLNTFLSRFKAIGVLHCP